MKELTKSLISLFWGASLLSLKQATGLLNSREVRSGSPSVDNLAAALAQELGEQGMLAGMFKAGDQLQKGAVDAAFGIFSAQALNPLQWPQAVSGILQQAAAAANCGSCGGKSGASDRPASGTAPGSAEHPPLGWGPVEAPSSQSPGDKIWPQAAAEGKPI